MRNPRVQEIWSQSTWSKLLSILEDVVSVKITNEFRYAQNLTWGLGHHIQYIRRLVIFKCVQGVLSSNGLFYWRLAKSCVDPAVKLIRFWRGLNRSLSNVRSNTSVGVNVRLNLSKAVLAGWSRLELLGPVFWPLSRRGTMLVPKSCASCLGYAHADVLWCSLKRKAVHLTVGAIWYLLHPFTCAGNCASLYVWFT